MEFQMYVTKTIRDVVIIVLGVAIFALGAFVLTHPHNTGRWLKLVDDARFFELDHDVAASNN
jgi:hypothetical protein